MIILLLAFSFRLLIFVNSSITLYSDEAIYASLARFWTNGHFDKVFHPTWPPLYPAISAAAYLFINNWENSLLSVSIISLLLLIVILFLIVERLLGRVYAIFYTLVLGFFTPILKASIFPLSDMLSTTLLILGIFFTFFALKNPEKKLFFFSAVSFGLAFLARTEGTLFFGLTLIYLLPYFLLQRLRNKASIKKILLVLSSFIITFFIVASPYILATSIQVGKPTISAKFSAQIKQEHSFQIRKNGTVWSQEAVSIKNPNYKSEFFRGGFVYLLENIDWHIWWFGEKLTKWKLIFLSNFPLWSVPIIIIGIFSLLRKKYFWYTLYLLYISATAIPFTIFSTPLADSRYLLWLFPILLLLFFVGVNFLLNKKLPKFAPLIALLVTLLFPSFNFNTVLNPLYYSKDYTTNYFREEILKASKWINDNKTVKEPRIMMRHESIEFYTDGFTVYLPQELTYSQMINYAKKNKVNYFIAWTEHLSNEKGLSFLLDKNINAEGMKRVYTYESPSRILIIYEILYP